MAVAQPNQAQGYSEFLPPSVISTLTDNAHLHDVLAQKQDLEKAQIEKHINECLKEIIRMFEALKLSLWAKADEKTAQFSSLFLSNLSLYHSNVPIGLRKDSKTLLKTFLIWKVNMVIPTTEKF